MTSSVNTSYDYNAAMESIRAEVEAYCEANGIDPESYLENLDGDLSLALIDNPTFEAYFQLAYVQLMEIVAPEVINSLEAQVGDVDFETLYANADDDLNALVEALIQDDPELMAFVANRESGQSEGEAVLSLLAQSYSQSNSDSEAQEYLDDARELAENYELGEGFDWVIEQEALYSSVEQSILDQLAEYDQAIVDLAEAFASGKMSEAEYEASLQESQFGREYLLMMLQTVTEQKATVMELISEMYKKISEMNLTVLRNWRT